MKRLFIVLVFVFFIFGQIWSQEGNLKSCLGFTRLFVDLYNNRQYSQIHQKLDSALQSKYNKDQLAVFLHDSLFVTGGKLLGFEHKSQTPEFQIFVLEFEKQKKEFHLSMNPSEEISVFEFYTLPEFLPLRKRKTVSNNPLLTGLDSLIHKLGEEYLALPQTCGLSIALVLNGQRMYYNYGETSRGSGQLPNQQSVYEIGSVTKTFTGLLLSQAIIENKVKSDDDIRDYLPGRYPNLAYGNTSITLVQLANHSSGLPRIPDNLFEQQNFDSLNPYKNYSEKMLYQDLHTQVIAQLPGTTCAYSNYGMAVLGKVLERVYKKPYSELVQEKILDKLKMQYSSVDLNEKTKANFLPGYAASGMEASHWELGVFAPAGGLHSCPEDFLTYLEYQLMEGDSACKLSHKPSIDKNEKLGLAWQILPGKNKADMLWHNGATFGFSSFCGFVPESKLGIVVLSNASASVDYIAIQLMKYIGKAQ